MSETGDYILDRIKSWVWSGFYGPDDIQGMIGDVCSKIPTKRCSASRGRRWPDARLRQSRRRAVR